MGDRSILVIPLVAPPLELMGFVGNLFGLAFASFCSPNLVFLPALPSALVASSAGDSSAVAVSLASPSVSASTGVSLVASSSTEASATFVSATSPASSLSGASSVASSAFDSAAGSVTGSATDSSTGSGSRSSSSLNITSNTSTLW